jgi:hypothetical protein
MQNSSELYLASHRNSSFDGASGRLYSIWLGGHVYLWSEQSARPQIINASRLKIFPPSPLITNKASISRYYPTLTGSITHIQFPKTNSKNAKPTKSKKSKKKSKSNGLKKYEYHSINVPTQTCITQDYVEISLAAVVSYQVHDSDGCETALEESQGGAAIAQVIIRRAEGAILDTMHTINLAEMVAEPHCLGKCAVDSFNTFIEQFGVTVVTFSVADVECPPEIADALREVL